MRLNSKTRRGFTLIELMFVILIILLLSGMLFKLVGIINDRSAIAKATADLQNIEHALNEYFAEYGIYPPVTFTEYEYERTDMQPSTMLDSGFTNAIGYRYGLVSHLYRRDGESWDFSEEQNGDPDFNPDTDRDKAAKASWAPYLIDIDLSTTYPSNSIGTAGGIDTYSNGVTTIPYSYESHPPYLSYTLE
jgi:prepilin-type N-terminal cleavage/methylation domain-containing protein